MDTDQIDHWIIIWLVCKVFSIRLAQFVNQPQPSLRCGLETGAKKDLKRIYPSSPWIIAVLSVSPSSWLLDQLDPGGNYYDQRDNEFGAYRMCSLDLGVEEELGCAARNNHSTSLHSTVSVADTSTLVHKKHQFTSSTLVTLSVIYVILNYRLCRSTMTSVL